MKFKGIFALCLAGVSMTAMAQTHVDGEEYYKADQLENAKDLLKRSLSNPQTDKAVSDYYLGLIAFEEGKDSEAANYFSQGISANPEYAYNYVGQGLLKLKAGDQKGAEELFKTADKNSKKDASLQIAIARAYDRVDPVRYEKQITKQVEKARKFNMENPDIYIFEGDQFKDQVKNADQSLANTLVGKAAGMYEMAANYDKNATAAYVKYANLFTMVNPDYAIKMLNNLLSVNPTSALGQRELANAYYNKKDYANAAKQYAAYVQNPSHFKSDESRYAFLLFYGQDFNNGYDYASKLLAEDPSNFTAQRYQFMNAAQIKEMKDQLLPMAEALYAAHKANPDKNKFAAIDYTLIAAELTDAKRPAEAVAVLEEGIKDIPDNLNFYKQLANVYVDENDLAKASDTYALSRQERRGRIQRLRTAGALRILRRRSESAGRSRQVAEIPGHRLRVRHKGLEHGREPVQAREDPRRHSDRPGSQRRGPQVGRPAPLREGHRPARELGRSLALHVRREVHLQLPRQLLCGQGQHRQGKGILQQVSPARPQRRGRPRLRLETEISQTNSCYSLSRCIAQLEWCTFLLSYFNCKQNVCQIQEH